MVSSTRYIIFHFAFSLINFIISEFLDEHVIFARAKLGQHVLAMEGMLATICDTLGCNDYNSELSIMTTLNRDQASPGGGFGGSKNVDFPP